MKPINRKAFSFIFVVLLLIQFLFVLADFILSKSGSDLTSITNPVIEFVSLPIGLINGNLPFYVREPIYIKIVYWVINLLVQTTLVYYFNRGFKRLRRKLK